jgi:hypothetical protein
MKKVLITSAVLVLIASGVCFAEDSKRFNTNLSFQPGLIFYKNHTEAYAVFGFDTSRDPLFLWTGFGYTVKTMPEDNSASALLYPWVTTTAGVTAFQNSSGDSFVRPQVSVPWANLSYQFPGLGLKAQWTLPRNAANRAESGFVFSGEFIYFLAVHDNPWYDQAMSDGVDVGSKYWKANYGLIIKYYYRLWHIDFQARFSSDNYAYNIEGRWSTITNTDWLVTLGTNGFAIVGGISTNGWNYSRNNGNPVPDILPNFSIILYP